MRSRILAAGAALALGALVLPAGASGPAPHIEDPVGDANSAYGQGLVAGGAADGTSTPQSYAPADLVSVTYATTYDRSRSATTA